MRDYINGSRHRWLAASAFPEQRYPSYGLASDSVISLGTGSHGIILSRDRMERNRWFTKYSYFLHGPRGRMCELQSQLAYAFNHPNEFEGRTITSQLECFWYHTYFRIIWSCTTSSRPFTMVSWRHSEYILPPKLWRYFYWVPLCLKSVTNVQTDETCYSRVRAFKATPRSENGVRPMPKLFVWFGNKWWYLTHYTKLTYRQWNLFLMWHSDHSLECPDVFMLGFHHTITHLSTGFTLSGINEIFSFSKLGRRWCALSGLCLFGFQLVCLFVLFVFTFPGKVVEVYRNTI